MKIKVRCDCGKTLVAPDRLAGKKARCSACGAVIRLPQLDAEPEQPANFFVTETGLNLTTEPQEGYAASADEMPHPFNFSLLEQTSVTSPECESSLGASDTNNAMNDGSGCELSTFAPPRGEGAVRQVGAKMRELDRIIMVILGLMVWSLTLGSPPSAWVLVHYLGLAAVVVGVTLEITDRVPSLKSRVQVVLGWLRERLNAMWDAVEIKKTWRVIGGVSFVLIAAFVVLPFILGGRRELKTEEIVTRSEGSVAFIKGQHGAGSGFVIAQGVLITNAHVLEDELLHNVEVHFPSAKTSDKGPFTPKLLYEDSQRDLAIVSIESATTPLKLAQKFVFRRGEDITVIGNPGIGGHILKNAVSRGVMSTETEIDALTFYQLGIAINPGNSGGPVFDSYGDVVGVVTARATEQEGLAFSVPLTDVKKALESALQISPAEAEEVHTRHRLAVVSRRIAFACRFNLAVMDVYVEAMEDNYDTLNHRRALELAQSKVKGKVDSLTLVTVRDVEEFIADEQAHAEASPEFTELWALFREISASLRQFDGNPHTNFKRHLDARLSFERRYQRSAEALKARLGLREL